MKASRVLPAAMPYISYDQRRPRSLPATWPTHIRNYYIVKVCVAERRWKGKTSRMV